MSNEINLHATNDSRDSAFLIFSKQSLLTNIVYVLLNSDDDALSYCDVKAFFRSSPSRADSSDPHFVSIAAFKTRDSSISSYTIGRTGLVGPCNNISGVGSLVYGCFCFNISKVFSVKGKIPFGIFSVKSLRAPLTFPFLVGCLNFE